MTQPQPSPNRPAAQRRSPLAGWLLGGLLAVGAVAGATAVFSTRTQNTTETFTQSLVSTLNATGKVKAEQTGYSKGFASSTQTMTLTIQPDPATKPLKLLVTNHIHHGPFPAFQAVGQATIDTDIRFEDPKIQAQVDSALGGQKPTIHTLVGLGGDTHSTLNVPSGQWKDDTGGTLRWQALSGHMNVSGNVTSSDLNWPGLNLGGDAENSGEISGITLQSRQEKREGSNLGIGGGTLKIARINFSGAAEGRKTQFAANNIQIGSDTTQTQGNFWDVTTQYDVGQLSSEGVDLKNVQLHLGFRHLAAEPLEALSKLINELQNQEKIQNTSGAPNLSDAQIKQVEDQLMALLKGQPRITLDRLSLSPGNGGAVTVTGEASAPKLAQLSAEDLQMVGQQPAALLGMFKLHLDAQASKAALADLSRMGRNGAGDLDSNLQLLLERGYLTQQGDNLHTTFDFEDGQALMNGKPMQR